MIARAGMFHPWDAMAPAALSGIFSRGPFDASAETGCGGSTIVLSHQSRRHTAFAIEGTERTITGLRARPELNLDNVSFVEGQTIKTLPSHRFEREFDLVLLDGPHAYPLPQLEYAYLFPRLKVGGWLVLDDIQIPSVWQLFQFLRGEPMVVLEEVLVRTAFFRRMATAGEEPDGWARQGINRSTILRYSWRDRLRALLR